MRSKTIKNKMASREDQDQIENAWNADNGLVGLLTQFPYTVPGNFHVLHEATPNHGTQADARKDVRG